jgi:hypothetical protein
LIVVAVTYPSDKGVNKRDRFGPDISHISRIVGGGGKNEFSTNFLALVAMPVYQSPRMYQLKNG